MQKITDQQYLHRQYLQTPIWKQKRLEALTYYGCICGRCGGYGNDVHHKTYERVGGGELISDLEVICRECHKAHHVAKVAAKMLGCEFYGKISKKALQKRYSPQEDRRGYPRNFDTLVWKRVNSLAEL